jgi:hypothetical protein
LQDDEMGDDTLVNADCRVGVVSDEDILRCARGKMRAVLGSEGGGGGSRSEEGGGDARHARGMQAYYVQPAAGAVDKEAWRQQMSRGMSDFRMLAAKR